MRAECGRDRETGGARGRERERQIQREKIERK